MFDLSFTGVGVGTLSFEDTAKLELHEGEDTTIEFPGPDGQKLRVPIQILRIDHGAREIGATFCNLSDAHFDAIEKLMFPRRAKVAEKAKA